MVKIKIQVVIEHEDEILETIEEEIGCLQRGRPSLETLGLTLAESKKKSWLTCKSKSSTNKSLSMCKSFRSASIAGSRESVMAGKKSRIEPCLAT